MSKQINRKLLFQYFSGNTTVLENAGIELWLKESQNEELFYLLLDEWERSNPQYMPSKDEVFKKFENQLQGDKGRYEGHLSTSINTIQRKWWVIAASVILAIGLVAITKDSIIYKHYQTQYGETMTLVLDDNSQVVLNANSYLKVPRWINYVGNRVVWMEGEAFFKVSKKINNRKFFVKTPDLSVEVLGTRFNVSSRHMVTKVVLQEGKVKVKSNANQKEHAYLKEAGDYAEVKRKESEILTKKVDETLYTTWQEKRLKFESIELQSVLQTIEDYYGVEIQTEDTVLADRRFSGTLPNNDLDVILQALSNIYSTDFKVSQK